MSKTGRYVSSPGITSKVNSASCDPSGSGADHAWDLARWRHVQRMRLADLREELGQAGRADISELIRAHLAKFLEKRATAGGTVLAGYWPIKGEPDLRPLLKELHRAGVTIALPLVETRAAPLVFRRWTPETRMVRGNWNIPVPPPEAEMLTPDITLAPCLGWSGECYRLGWGGGYFDRTLAVLDPPPLAIGIALGAAHLPTIYPQSHDIPLDLIVTEEGLSAERMAIL